MDLLRYIDKLEIKTVNNINFVFDPIRKKKIQLTPEEMVRQLFINYLLEELKISKKHIAVEKELVINKKHFRFDILVFNKTGKPSLIVECKSHKIELTEAVAIQVSKYNIALEAKYLCVTNGIKTLMYLVDYENLTTKLIQELDLDFT